MEDQRTRLNHILCWQRLHNRSSVLTRGAGSNCRMTCCMKTSRCVGRSFNRSMLLKYVHWSSDTWERKRPDGAKRRVKSTKGNTDNKGEKLFFTHISQIIFEILIFCPDDAHGWVRALSSKHTLLWRDRKKKGRKKTRQLANINYYTLKQQVAFLTSWAPAEQSQTLSQIRGWTFQGPNNIKGKERKKS